MTFTPEQLAALARDRHLVVTANAGAGKTGVLTERFLRIVLEDDVDLSKVVAITFTNKAAAEMRARVGRKLRDTIDDPDAPSTVVARARRVLSRISTARIGTFHAFCGSLLRSFADEAGLDADVRELLPREAAAKQRDAVMTAIRSWMDDPDRRDALLRVLDELGVNGLERAVLDLVSSGEGLHQVRRWRTAHAGVNEILAARRQASLRIFAADAAVQLQTIAEHMREVISAGLPMSDVIPSFAAWLATAIDTLTSTDDAAIANLIPTLYDRLLTVYTKSATIRKDLVVKGASTPAIPERYLRRFETLQTGTFIETMERLQVELLDVVLGVASDAAVIYTRTKDDEHALDFDDLMLRTLELLTTHQHVADDVRRGITHLMVDEFQDTNPTQYDVVRALVPDLDATRPRAEHCPMLFIVGDAKQSIYRFRAADVRLFDRATSEIEAANARRGWASGRIVLAASFRMAPGCATAINAVCSEVVIKRSSFDVDYEPIVCARTVPSDAGGSMSVIVTDTTKPDDPDDDWTKLAAECRHIAAVTARIADGTTPLMIETKGTVRAAAAGDIAILVRKSADATTLGSHLRDLGVPYQVLGGRGFFSRPEVADLRNLLRWATDPRDDLACLALLRSPLLRCTDDDLYHIACMGQGAMWERALRARDNAETSDRVRNAVSHMQRFLLDIRVLPVPTFIREALSSTQWHATIGDDPRREQILANVDKLIDIVRDASRDGLATVRDIVQSIGIPDRDTEAEQSFVTDPNAVRIMTLHAAKGLEFPVVILACISSKGGGAPGAMRMSDEIGPTFSVSSEVFDRHDPTSAVERGEAASHEANAMVDAEADLAEDRRLIYVGLTRARDHVIVSLPFARTRAGLGKWQGLAAVLAPVLHDRREVTEVTDEGWDLGNGTHVRAWLDTGIIHRYAGAQAARRPVRRLDASLVDRVSVDMVSATELLSAALLDEEPSAATIADEIADAHGAAYGTVMHFVLQHGMAMLGDDADERAQRIADMLSTRAMTDAARDAALDEALRVLDAPLIRTYAERLGSAMLETSLTAALDGVTIYGVMDACITIDEASMEVWDWKTTVVTDDDHMVRVAASYTEQMRVYAWLCLRTQPAVEHVTTRLLFTKALGRCKVWTVDHVWHRRDMPTIEAALGEALRALTSRRAVRAGLLRLTER